MTHRQVAGVDEVGKPVQSAEQGLSHQSAGFEVNFGPTQGKDLKVLAYHGELQDLRDFSLAQPHGLGNLDLFQATVGQPFGPPPGSKKTRLRAHAHNRVTIEKWWAILGSNQ
ncbi:MAG: hypothetical protein HYV27_08020 [Candidatus Hydrogenedentes bacterium]|nr:hypothetical protein [Candidatus Hydrogenedentota bacterium]